MILEKTSVIYDPETKIVFGEFSEGTEVHLANANMYEGFLIDFLLDNTGYSLLNNF